MNRDLLEAARTALIALARIEPAVTDDLGPEEYRALAEAQEVLAQAHTRSGGSHIAGLCEMCGQRLPNAAPGAVLCGHCERSYGPADPDE